MTQPRIRNLRRRVAAARRQAGMTVVVVLILLSVMLMGGLALARLGEVGTLVAGNVASKEASMQASEVGTAAAFAAIQAAGFDENVSVGNWYFPQMQPGDANGVPNVAWPTVPQLTVGRYNLNYVVERMCDKPAILDVMTDCLVREVPLKVENATPGEKVEPPNARQFRVTVRVTDRKGTQTWIQAMVSRS